MTEERVVRKLRAIFSADVKGYSRLMGEDEKLTVKTITAYREIMAGLIEKFTGRVVDSPGDNILAEFSSAVDAVECAVAVQDTLKKKNSKLLENRQMVFRIGINLGDVIQEGKRIYGDGVNIAARIEGLADPGGVSVSRSVYNQVNKKLPFGFADMGEHAVKNIEIPVRVFRVLTKPDEAHLTIPFKDSKPKRRPWTGAIVALFVASVVSWFIYQFQTKPEFEPASVEKMAYQLPDRPSIAVIPFENLSGGKEQEYFCAVITRDIITTLSKIPKLFVIGRISMISYQGKPMKVKHVSEELGYNMSWRGVPKR